MDTDIFSTHRSGYLDFSVSLVLDITLGVVFFNYRRNSMSKVKFSSEQQEILRNNKYTVRVTANILSLSKEFKEIFYKVKHSQFMEL